MIFAYSTDDGSLMSFEGQAEAISYAEGIDVEEGMWRFFAQDGAELLPVFTAPNQRSGIVVRSGHYILVPSPDAGPTLLKILSQIRAYEGAVRSEAQLLSVLKTHGRASDAQPTVQGPTVPPSAGPRP